MKVINVDVPRNWVKLTDLIQAGREGFVFEADKTYYIHNASKFILYFLESDVEPQEDGLRLYAGKSGAYVRTEGKDLWVRNALPVEYPLPEIIRAVLSSDVVADSAIPMGSYTPHKDVRGAYVFKGSVAKRADLPKDPAIGDVYNIENEDGMNVAWTGSVWDDLGATVNVDLTPYAKKAEVEAKLDDIKANMSVLATKTELTEALAAKAEAADVVAIESKLEEKADQSEFKALSNKVEGKASLADIDGLLFRVGFVEDKVSALSKTNTEVVAAEAGATLALSDTTKDFVISGEIANAAQITGKSVTLKDTSISNATLTINADTDVEMKSVSLTGSYPTNSGKVIKADNGEYVTVRDSVFDASACYNMIEIGLNGTTLPKGVLIENCKFTGKYSNNAILIFGTQDNAVININNCYFEDVSNVIRLSNKTNAKNVTVNITNCTCDHWDTTPKWSGLMLCQDYTSGSAEAAIANNLFAPDKITINISNLTTPSGEKLAAPEDMATICGSATTDQVFYLWDNYRGSVSYDPAVYPAINIL